MFDFGVAHPLGFGVSFFGTPPAILPLLLAWTGVLGAFPLLSLPAPRILFVPHPSGFPACPDLPWGLGGPVTHPMQ